MLKRSVVAVVLILGALLTHGTAARGPQAAPAPSRFSRAARLQARVSGPSTLTLQGNRRQAFEKLASSRGVQVVFHPAFTEGTLPQEISLNPGNLADGFDQLAQLTGAFWETFDAKTVLVAPDVAATRRQVEAQAVKAIALPADATGRSAAGIIAALRARSQFTKLATGTSGNFLLVWDTPENVALAEDVVAIAGGGQRASAGQADASGFLVDLAGNVFVPEGTGLRKIPAPSHARLKPVASGPIVTQVQGSSRAAFQALADNAGVQVFFHRQTTDTQIVEPLVIDGVDFMTAMDLLGFRTGTFWYTLDERTIVVAPDNPTVRRDAEPLAMKVFNLKNVARQQEITEVVTAWRGLLNVNQVVMGTPQRVLLLRDTDEKIALAERIFAEFDRGPGSANARLAEIVREPSIPSGVFAVPVDADERRAMLDRLQPKFAGPIAVQMNQNSRQAFQTIAAMAGIQVVFHRQFQPGAPISFAIRDADLGVALDRLSFVTDNFWTVVGPGVLVVAPDNPNIRREIEQMVLRTLPTRNMASQGELTEAVTALRTLFTINQIVVSTPLNMLVLRDEAHKIALSEKVMAVFDRPRSGAAAGAPNGIAGGLEIPSGVFAVPADKDSTRATRKQLQAKAMPGAISFDQPPRQAFETLASMAGVQIVFDRQFQSTAPIPFACENCDFSSAMDRLAFQTQTFWSVTGEKTVVVAPDNPTVRRRVEDMIVKAFYLGSLTTSREATELVTALRTLVSVNQVVVNSASNAIVIRDTADKIGLSEKIVTAFDPKATFSAPISSGAFANPMDRDARRSRLPLQLQLSSAGLLAARFNQSSRDTYDTVAGLAGIRVEFHPQFGNSPSFFFQVDSVDWITAMDTLAFQTETFWIPRDRQTILVASDNPTMRKEVIPEETKTIQWKNINSATAATEVVTMLRTLASLRDVQAAGPNAVTVTAVPDVIALSERLVALVDIAGRTPAAPPTTNPQNSPGNPPGPPPNFVPPPGPVAPGLIPFGSPFNNPNAPPQGTVLPPPFPAR